jgi:hypothetical protein
MELDKRHQAAMAQIKQLESDLLAQDQAASASLIERNRLKEEHESMSKQHQAAMAQVSQLERSLMAQVTDLQTREKVVGSCQMERDQFREEAEAMNKKHQASMAQINQLYIELQTRERDASTCQVERDLFKAEAEETKRRLILYGGREARAQAEAIQDTVVADKLRATEVEHQVAVEEITRLKKALALKHQTLESQSGRITQLEEGLSRFEKTVASKSQTVETQTRQITQLEVALKQAQLEAQNKEASEGSVSRYRKTEAGLRAELRELRAEYEQVKPPKSATVSAEIAAELVAAEVASSRRGIRQSITDTPPVERRPGSSVNTTLSRRMEKALETSAFPLLGGMEREVPKQPQPPAPVVPVESGEELVVSFRPGPIGIEVAEESDGIVDHVWKGQAAGKGIKPGMRLLKIDDEPFTEKLLRKKALGTSSYTILVTSNSAKELGETRSNGHMLSRSASVKELRSEEKQGPTERRIASAVENLIRRR